MLISVHVGLVGLNQRETRVIQGEGAQSSKPRRVEAPARPRRFGWNPPEHIYIRRSPSELQGPRTCRGPCWKSFAAPYRDRAIKT